MKCSKCHKEICLLKKMVDKQKAYNKRNEVLSNFKNLSGSFSNCIKINPHNSKEHELKKSEIAIDLIKNGIEVFTEIELKKGGVCDILAIYKDGEPQIVEIINTETKESLESKKLKYPYNIVEIKA